MAASLIHQVEAHDDAISNLENLEDQIQIALQTCGIDDDHGDIRLPKQDEVTGDLFVRTACLQGVGTRQIDDLDLAAVVLEHPFSASDGLAWPVAGVLPQPGQRIEDGTLAGVWVTSQCHEVIPAAWVESQLHQLFAAV